MLPLQRCLAIAFFSFASPLSFAQKTIGLFENNSDVGIVLYKGSSSYNSKTGDYKISGSGANIWGGHDEF